MKTLKLRIKDKHASALVAMAREVNQVWNYANELSYRSIRERQKWLSAYDLQKYTAGFSKCEGVKVGSATVQRVCEEYATRRRQFKKARLNWRVSKYELRAGSISQDPQGRWYLNVAVDVGCKPSKGVASVGIDLGLKTAAVCSSGETLASCTYCKHEPALAIAQRARKKGRTRAIHAKIANVRKDAMHKFSTRLVQQNAVIFVGNMSSKALIKTKMAKSTLDAGWSMLKTMLEYKSHQAGIVFEEVNESYTTQTCSRCGVIPASSPKGRAGLRIR
jgi:putative transposase